MADEEPEARAVGRMMRISPRKLNDVAREIRGLNIEEASRVLQGSRRRIALQVEKVLKSAVANADARQDLDVDRLVVAEAWVGKNLRLRRGRPRARGRFGPIEKFFSQVTIVVRESPDGRI